MEMVLSILALLVLLLFILLLLLLFILLSLLLPPELLLMLLPFFCLLPPLVSLTLGMRWGMLAAGASCSAIKDEKEAAREERLAG